MKSYFFLILFAVLAWASPGQAMGRVSPFAPTPPGDSSLVTSSATGSKIEAPVKAAMTSREKVIAVAAQEIGVLEATGKNDGPRVEAYLKSVGLAKGNPYCAAGVYWSGKQALGNVNPYPRSGWSPDFVTPPTWTYSKGGQWPQPGDAGGIYFSNKGRIAHTFLIAGSAKSPTSWKWRAPSGYFRTIEFNTSLDASAGSARDREGGGVASKLRPVSTVWGTKDWIGNH